MMKKNSANKVANKQPMKKVDGGILLKRHKTNTYFNSI